jgi:hypothetical protein
MRQPIATRGRTLSSAVIAANELVSVAVTVVSSVSREHLRLTTIGCRLRTHRIDVNAEVVIDGARVSPSGDLTPASGEVNSVLMFALLAVWVGDGVVQIVLRVGTGASAVKCVDLVDAILVLTDNRKNAPVAVEHGHDLGECAHLSVGQVL